MRRWNGWGDHNVIYPLPAKAEPFLNAGVGESKPPQDTHKENVLNTIPVSRLPMHPLVSTAAEERLCHARGQSLPDWIALRSGRIQTFPDGVAYPQNEAEVQTLLRYASDVGAKLIPYGGGTSVVGHINPQPGDAPVLTIDMRCLNQLQAFDQWLSDVRSAATIEDFWTPDKAPNDPNNPLFQAVPQDSALPGSG